MNVSETQDMKGKCHEWRGRSLCYIIVYGLENIEIFEVILNEMQIRSKLVSVEKGKLL
jgi:hypothetical protein